MRITNLMTLNNTIRHLNENQEIINQYQEKISSGKQFSVASDDPLAASMSLQLRSSQQTLQGYQDTADLAKDWMNASEISFQQMEDIANRSLTLITSGLNDTVDPAEKKNTIAKELDSLLSQAIETGNSTQSGQYLFSGFKVNSKPFTLNGDGTISYDGDDGLMQRNLGPGQSITMNVQGEKAFRKFFEVLVQAKNALSTNNMDSLQSALGNLHSSLDTLDQYRTSLGASLNKVQQISDFMDKMQIETQSLLSKKEDINTAECISILSTQQTNYQAVLEVSQRAISALSLFDYLNK
jgi:flagellar hook-associated protein 3 FlgL